jgi:hypothetical protein
MKMRAMSAWAFVALLAACENSPQSSAPPQAPTTNGAAVVEPNGQPSSAPYAATGTTFEVRLDEPIDTSLSHAGDRITATLSAPITTSGGTTLIPVGTRVEGHVVSIDRDTEGPRIVLDFDTMRIGGGLLPVGTRVVSAQQNRYRTVPANSGVTSLQTSPGAGAAETQGTSQIAMPKGAAVQLALTRPIVQSTAAQ